MRVTRWMRPRLAVRIPGDGATLSIPEGVSMRVCAEAAGKARRLLAIGVKELPAEVAVETVALFVQVDDFLRGIEREGEQW